MNYRRYSLPIRLTLRTLTRTIALILAIASCSGEVTTSTTGGEATTVATDEITTTGTPSARDCIRLTGANGPVSTGSPATDALFLSGEAFICADEVVLADPSDLNSLAAAAQLAAALDGPLLLPHPQVAAEIGRLKPKHLHVVGELEVIAPPEAQLTMHNLSTAVAAAKLALAATDEILLPAAPDASTIVETISAIASGDRVVQPQTPASATTTPPPALNVVDIVTGLAIPGEGPAWLVDANDPVTLLLAAATGSAAGAQVIAIDTTNVLAYPSVGAALQERDPTTLRFIGAAPEGSEWELAVLVSGNQLPGGGYSILGDDTPKRYVAFYGHPETEALGVLGEQGPQATLDRMAPFLEQYTADGYQAIPTFEVMASVAAADATTDGDYSFEWPVSTFTEWIDVAREQGAYVILDLQPGREDFLSQAKLYEELLLQPHVGLALDPEWRLKPDELHLRQIGRVEASEVNLVVDWLADLVRDNGLPQKMIIVHQFREFMIQERATLKERPELQMVIQMDGQGPIPTKDTTWAALTRGTEENHWRWGWKNFFDEDSPTPTPEHTMGKVPTPVFVSYQ